ncbi:MAG: sigma-70 family RNA polymerase sigma factor [Myxococcota bacterium]
MDEAFEELAWQATQTARAAHPGVSVTPAAWAAALLTSTAGDGAQLADLQVADLWLATALSSGDATAMSTFETALMPEVDRAILRFCSDAEARTELRQRVRIRLLVSRGPNLPARIRSYAGQGRLAAWVRTAAGRLAINVQKAARAHAPLDDLPETVLPQSPEIALLRSEDRVVFKELLKASFRILDDRDRTLLRLRYGQGMTATAIARAYGVHESTLSRRLAAARRCMAEAFEQRAAETYGTASDGGTVNAWRFVQSQVEWNLESILRTTDE